MNLIEQLGGYERAKAIVDKAPCKTYTFHNHPYQKGYIRCFGGDGKEYFLVSDIEEALLEYRRQHNIFEAGDLIFDLSDDDEKYTGQILAVSEIGLDFLVCYDKQGKRFCVITDDAVHATDAEIQAGKRLEVNP